jgi:superfamily II DNA or RNA helicase
MASKEEFIFLRQHLMPDQDLSFPELSNLKSSLLARTAWQPPLTDKQPEGKKRILVLRKHKYYTHFVAEIYEAGLSSNGKLKNPLVLIDPLDFIWKVNDPDELKFYAAIARLRSSYDAEHTEADMEGLKALVKNPLALDVYYHDPEKSANVSLKSIVQVKLGMYKLDLRLEVVLRKAFYEITARLYIAEKAYNLDLLNIKFQYFFLYNGVMQLIDNLDYLQVIEVFKRNNNRLYFPEEAYEEFQRTILSKLEGKVKINYAYLKPATKKQLQENNFDTRNERLIYLSDSGDYVLITPVIRYGNVEVPVLSQQQIYAVDSTGIPFTVQRDEQMEDTFIRMLRNQHPLFLEQEAQECYYLHKKRFLDEGWFLNAFAYWQQQEIKVLGFNDLEDNKLNPNTAKISIEVISGLDWFETGIKISYGKQQVSLKHLAKALRNKSKFVELGDGTMGVLPEEWVAKLNAFLEAGEVVEEVVRTPKVNIVSIDSLYEDEMLTAPLRMEIKNFRRKLEQFNVIGQVQVPETFLGTLRHYQQEGLNWLNFLDEFGFGGCLADDMGLGKTIQIIAFLLLQKGKSASAPSMIIVPATLIFNWQAEIKKFAPSLKVHTIYGADRDKHVDAFQDYDVVLSSYGTILQDIRHLKHFRFNYVFLDESQTIKNPNSQRYKAIALLKSRSKVMLTGTPLENNTFDLYAQFSLACPGLLGTRKHFKDQYVVPIDKFNDTRKAHELQRIVRPFLLRRTKKQVATELPEKTEMVIYCEMGAEQRKVYDSYKLEYRNYLMSQKSDELAGQTMHILKGMTLLRQICNSPALISNDVFYGNASAKIETLMEEIEGKSGEHKILIFSSFVGMLDLVRAELQHRKIGYSYLTGQTTKREAEVKRFSENPDVRVFLISLKAGGTGLNLTEADYVYLIDPWWNPAAEQQAIDRVYRLGQQKHVVAVRLICPDTIEDKIMQLQQRKQRLVEDIIKTEGNLLQTLGKAELLELFS